MRKPIRLWAALFVSMWAIIAWQTNSLAQSESEVGQFETPDELRSVIAMLIERIVQLETRVAMLEGGHNELPDQPSAKQLKFDGVMQIDSFELLPADQSLLAEAAAREELARDKEKLALEARKNERKYGELYDRWRLNEDDEREKELEYRRLRDKYRTDAFLLESDAKKLRKQAERLRADAISPRHIITGWDGVRTMTIRTTRDLSPFFNKFAIGGFVGWRGLRTDAGADFEIWEVIIIEVASTPVDFAARP